MMSAEVLDSGAKSWHSRAMCKQRPSDSDASPGSPDSNRGAESSTTSADDLARLLQEREELRAILEEKERLLAANERLIGQLELRIHELQKSVERLDAQLQFLKKAADTPKEQLEALERALATTLQNLDGLKKAAAEANKERYAPKTEKNRRFDKPTPKKTPEQEAEARAQASEKRAESRRANDEGSGLDTEAVFVEAPEEVCGVDGCQKTLAAWPDSQAETSVIFQFIPGHFQKLFIHRQKRSCPDHSERISRAPAPARPMEGKSKWSAEAMAAVIVNKFSLHLPLNRQLKILRRAGSIKSLSSLSLYVQDIADHLRPLWLVLLASIKLAELVLADETYLRCLDKRPRALPEGAEPTKGERDLEEEEARRRDANIDRRRPPDQRTHTHQSDKPVRGMSYLWVFIDPEANSASDTKTEAEPRPERAVFYFSVDRSGKTPCLVLGRSTGILLTDAYSGYNQVTKPGLRDQAGCHVHNRRYYWKLSKDSPERAQILELYEQLYLIENEARERAIVGTAEHLELRQTRSKPLIEKFETLLKSWQPLPSSALYKAKTYTENNWAALTLFLSNPKIPLDNNGSERRMCEAAMGRSNWRHIGNLWSGEALAVSLTIIQECERCDVDPATYIAHMLMVPAAELEANAAAYLPEVWKLPEGMKPGDPVPLYGPEVKLRRLLTETNEAP